MTPQEKRDKEEAEKERRIKLLGGLVDCIMGQVWFNGAPLKWDYSPQSWDLNYTLKTDDGRGFYLRCDPRGKARVEVSGLYPKHENSYILPKEHVSISVSLERAPKEITKEIARRFMPGYLEQFAYTQDVVKSRTERKARMVAAGEALARWLRTDFDPDRVRETVEVSGYRPEWVKVSSHDGESFKIEAHNLDLNTIRALCTVLKPYKAEERTAV